MDTTDVQGHILAITLSFTSPWDKPVLQLPVWTPGSYKIRDYSRYIRTISATVQGVAKPTKKNSKSSWIVDAETGEEVIIKYEIYAFEFTVRTSYLTDRYALLSPASLFFYLTNSLGDDNKHDKIKVGLILPDQWSVFNSMEKNGELFVAESYDDLVDSPFALAHADAHESLQYEIENSTGEIIPCEIALVGFRGNHNIEEFRDAMIKLQEHSKKMFGELPYDRYLWALYVVDKGGGGLEHRFNNFSIINRWYFDPDNKMNYARLLSLEAHEHFHTYNIKRIRPSQLGPFDYTKEVYTSLLWVAEGMTSYYDNVILPRSKLIDEITYWKIIAKDYTSLQKIPGREFTSISESSFDAWIKLYQPHENSNNLFVSYYLKGGLVSLLLDLEIRIQSNWENSLDDFFRSMWDAYKVSHTGYDENQLQALIENATGSDLSEFWGKYITGTDPIPLEKYLKHLGMSLREKSTDDPHVGWKLSSDKLRILSVDLKSAAMQAGLSTGDKLVALNEFEISSTSLQTLLTNYKKQDVSIHFIRDGKLRNTQLSLSADRVSEYEILDEEEVTDTQKQHREMFFN